MFAGYGIQVDYHLICVVSTGGAGCVCRVRDPGSRLTII